MINILVAEDEVSIRVPIILNLKLEGYHVDYAEDGEQAIEKMIHTDYDLLILDLMMPKKSGEQVLEELKSKKITTPIIIISAKDSPKDRFTGLQAGALDYITKPFIIDELLIRVKNILNNRPEKQDQSSYTIGGNLINFKSLTIQSKNNKIIQLTAKESKLLELFVSNPDIALSREKIISNVWNMNENHSTRTIDNFVAQFRKYFEEDPKNPQYFISIRGVGYMFST